MTITTLNELQSLNFSECSHKLVTVACSYNLSDKCRKIYKAGYRDLVAAAKNHEDKICCFNCSRMIKASHISKGMGRTNPNTKYHKLDDSFLKDIDTKEKAYVLGWIASDGSISKKGITISIVDKEELGFIRDIICPDLPLKVKFYTTLSSLFETSTWVLSISSKQMALDAARHLGINLGKKSDIVNFPHNISDNFKWDFIRGVFEGDGHVSRAYGASQPKCDISSNSSLLRNSIEEFTKIPCSNSDKTNRIYWSGVNCLDFLAKIYEGTTAEVRLRRKYERFLDWSNWVPSLKGRCKSPLHIKFARTSEVAVTPSKLRASDVGYDLTILSVWKKYGNVTIYETGIKMLPDFGWYLMMAPRSSISKTGYMLANSIGVLDRSYVGTIKVPLIKVDPDAPDLELPCKMVQVIPCLGVHAQIIEVDSEELSDTSRNSLGFGSSGS